MNQDPTHQNRAFIKDLVPNWRPSRDQRLWMIRITIVLVVLLGTLIVLDLIGPSPWEGLRVAMVPLAVAIVAFFLNRVQRERELGIAEEQRKRELGIAKAQQDRDYELADRHTQDTVLQEYLSQMANLLMEGKLLDLDDNSKESPPRLLARSRTLWALWQIDGHRKAPVFRFLHEAHLIQHTFSPEGDNSGIVWLSGADLREAQLQYNNLENAGLDGADLKQAVLTQGRLKDANLSGADLKWAKLGDADLSNADLSNADLSGAEGITEEQLERAKSLKNTTMPNGQKYEDWLKDKKVINCLGVRDDDLPPDV